MKKHPEQAEILKFDINHMKLAEKDNPLISVVTVVLNGERYIEYQIEI
jgi:hypothetical protein